MKNIIKVYSNNMCNMFHHIGSSEMYESDEGHIDYSDNYYLNELLDIVGKNSGILLRPVDDRLLNGFIREMIRRAPLEVIKEGSGVAVLLGHGEWTSMELYSENESLLDYDYELQLRGALFYAFRKNNIGFTRYLN